MKLTAVRNCFSGEIIGNVPSTMTKQERDELFDWLHSLPEAGISGIALELHKLGEIISRRRDEIAAIYSAESGKPLKFALSEISRSADILNNLCINIKAHDSDDSLPEIQQSVVGTPFRSTTLSIPSGSSVIEDTAISIASSIIGGNKSLIVPGLCNPLTIIKVGEAVSEVGNLGHHVKLLPSASVSSGKAFPLNDSRIGSTNLFGRKHEIEENFRKYNIALKYRLSEKKKSVAVIWKDSDADLAVETVFNGSLKNDSGYDDIRFVVVHPEQSKYVQNQLVERFTGLVNGDPLLPGTDIGPAGNSTELQAAVKSLDEFVAAGNEYIVKGANILPNLVAPSLIKSYDGKFPSAHEYKYLAIAESASVDDAIRLLNGSGGVSSAVVFTSDVHLGGIFSRQLDCDYMFYNDFPSYSRSALNARKFDLQRAKDIVSSLTSGDRKIRRIFYES